jgi:hypothetical protein
MENRKFDAIARTLGARQTRRGALRTLGAAALGAVGLASLKGAASADGHKVGICHQTGSESNPAVHIAVAANSLDTHLAHGDYVSDLTDVDNCGTCGNVCTAPENATASSGEGGCGYSCNEGYEDDGAGGCSAISFCACYSSEEPTCYWMETDTGNFCWVPTIERLGVTYDEAECNAAGSGCPFGGGCYLWSTNTCA